MQMIGLARLGADMEVRYTPNGDAVGNMSLAFNYGKKDTGGNRPTQWISASLWGERAEKLGTWLTKGRLILVHLDEPHIEVREHNGKTYHNLVARVAHLEFAGGNEGDERGGQQQRQSGGNGGGQSARGQHGDGGAAYRQASGSDPARQRAPQQREPRDNGFESGGGRGPDGFEDDVPFMSAQHHRLDHAF